MARLSKLLQDALELTPHASDGRVEIPLPDGLTRLFIGSALKSAGPTRFYIGAPLPPDGLIPAPELSRAFAGGSVARNKGWRELQQFSPYGPADVRTNPRETTDWFVGRISAVWEASSRLSSPLGAQAAVAQAPDLTPPDSQVAAVESEPEAADPLQHPADQREEVDDSRAEHLADLQRELEALRRDRDVTQELLGVADRETADLQAALEAAEERAQHATRAAAEAEAEVIRVLDQAAPPTGAGVVDVGVAASELSEILELALGDRAADATTLEILERAYRLVDEDPRLGTLLGRQYLSVGRWADAAKALTNRPGVPLSPVAAALLVEAFLADHRVPEPSVIERADWPASRAASLLSDAEWLTQADVVSLAPALAANPFPGAGAWFEQAWHHMTPDASPPLMEAWRSHDPDAAAKALLEAIQSRRISTDSPWVKDGLQSALDLREESVVAQAIAALLETARRSDDKPLLHQLSSVWRRRLTGRERLLTGAAVAKVQSDLRAGAAPDQDEAQILVDLYWEAKRLRDDRTLIDVLALVDRARSTATGPVQALLDQCRRPDVRQAAGSAQPVSNVLEALEYVGQKYPELVVLPEAVDSARRRGASGYKVALRSLEALGEVAREYENGSLGASVQEACRLLPGFKEDISDSAKQQFRADYERQLPDGRTVMLGPHISGGLRGGRIYFFIDEKQRRIVVGHVGKHLRGAQDP